MKLGDGGQIGGAVQNPAVSVNVGLLYQFRKASKR
jgi:hypothetical protein